MVDIETSCLVACQWVSLCASVWLLWQCWLVPSLLARQLRHLAVADMLFSVMAQVMLIIVGVAPQKDLHIACLVDNMVLHFFLITSALLELHIALGVTAAVVHSTSALKVLQLSLLFAWPLGAILTTVDMLTIIVKEDGHAKIQFFICRSESPIVFPLFAVTLGIGLVSFFIAVVRSCQIMGDAAMKRTVWRAVLFPLSLFISFGPPVIFNYPGAGVPTSTTAWLSMWCAASLNGFMNALTYGAVEPWNRLHDHVVGFALRPSTVSLSVQGTISSSTAITSPNRSMLIVPTSAVGADGSAFSTSLIDREPVAEA